MKMRSIGFFFTLTTQILALSLANFLSSISGQTHEFIIYAMRKLAREENLTVCHDRKKKTNGRKFFMRLSCYRQ